MGPTWSVSAISRLYSLIGTEPRLSIFPTVFVLLMFGFCEVFAVPLVKSSGVESAILMAVTYPPNQASPYLGILKVQQQSMQVLPLSRIVNCWGQS